MNWAVLGKISGIICAGGGFGFSSWLFWPKPETTTNSGYLYVYTMSENVDENDLSPESFNTRNFNKNFECKISQTSFSCEILQPKIGVSATSTLKDKYQANPEKVNKQDLKSANNVYVVKMDEQHKNTITSSTTQKIEVVSTKDKNKKYASLKINLTLDSRQSVVIPTITSGNASTDSAGDVVSIIMAGITKSNNDTNQKHKQLIQVVEDTNKMDIAKKVFKDCRPAKTPQRSSCENVDNSLNLLLKNFDTNFSNQKEGYAIEVLAKADEKKVMEFFDNLNIIEKFKSNSDISTYTLGVSDPILRWISNWYATTAITQMENTKTTP